MSLEGLLILPASAVECSLSALKLGESVPVGGEARSLLQNRRFIG
jgi:hypothetical protein